MTFLRDLLLTVSLLACAMTVQARGAYIGLGGGLVETDISSVNSNDKTFDLKLFGGYQFGSHFGLELGAFFFEELERDTEGDSDGEFKVSFARQDVYLGPSFKVRPFHLLSLKANVGITYSQIDMTVEESFFGLKPEGRVEVKDKVQGYFLSLGLEPHLSKDLRALIAIDYLHRPEVFNQSRQRFDMREIGLSFNLVY